MVLLVVTPGVIAQNSASSPHRPAPQGGAKVITVWKVGDPYTGGTPDTAVPPSLELAAEKLGYGLRAEAFPIQGFASLFFRAFENHQPPDILVFNNHGVLEGISTPIGSFSGIGTDPAIHAALVQVTESLTALEGRGWEYLIRTSPGCNGTPCTAQTAGVAELGAGVAQPASSASRATPMMPMI